MPTSVREAEIRAEEQFRHMVREELERARPPKSPWGFLNAPLFLWFLSSVVLASISFLYARHDEQQRKSQELQTVLRRLDAEMAIRLDHLIGLVDDPAVTPSRLRLEIVQTWIGERGNIYPEYKSLGLFSMAALAQMHAQGTEASEIQSARLAFDRLWKGLKQDVDWRDPAQLETFAAAARPLIRLAALPRWRLDVQEARPR